jgi:hypothetical protein
MSPAVPAAVVVAALLFYLALALADGHRAEDRREGRHRSPRPATPRLGGVTRAARRALTAARGLPGAIKTWGRALGSSTGPVTTATCPAVHFSVKADSPAPVIHHEPGLAAEDAATLTWLRTMRGLRHPGWTTLALAGRIAVLGAVLNVPGRDVGTGGKRAADPVTPAGDPRPTPTCLLAGDERLAAEVEATRPWEHDTAWFTLPAIDADVAKAGA